MNLEIELIEGGSIYKRGIFTPLYTCRHMKTIALPVPPGVRMGGAKTTVQIPVDAPTESSSNHVSRKRFLTILCDGSGFCKYPIFKVVLYARR